MARHVEGRGNETPRDLGRNAFVRVVRCALLRPLDVPGLALLAFRERVARARALRRRRCCLSDGGVPLPLHRALLRGALALRLSVLRRCRLEPRALAGVVEQRRDTRHCSCTARAVSALAARARQPQEGSHATCSLFRFGTILAADAIEVMHQVAEFRRRFNLTDAGQPRKNCRGDLERPMITALQRQCENVSIVTAVRESLFDPRIELRFRSVFNREEREQAHFCVRERSWLLTEPALGELSRRRLCQRPVVSISHAKTPSSEQLQHEGRAHDHYLVGTTAPERLRGGVRWRIRTGARLKSSEQRRGLSSSGCGRQPFEPTC